MSFPQISEFNTSSTEKLAEQPTSPTGGKEAAQAKPEVPHSIYLSSRMNRHIRRFLDEKKGVEEMNLERQNRARPENRLGKKNAIEHVPN